MHIASLMFICLVRQSSYSTDILRNISLYLNFVNVLEETPN